MLRRIRPQHRVSSHRKQLHIPGAQPVQPEKIEVMRTLLSAINPHDQRIALALLVIGRQQKDTLQFFTVRAPPLDQSWGAHPVPIKLWIKMCQTPWIAESRISDPEIGVMVRVFCKIGYSFSVL